MRRDGTEGERALACDEAGSLISAEADGAASEAERLLVARHVARCGACARMRADFLSLGARAAAADPVAGAAPSSRVWDAIERHIRAPHDVPVPAPVPAPVPVSVPVPVPAPSARASLPSLRRAAAVAAVAGAFVAGRWTAPSPSSAPPGAAVVAAPAVSPEAEDKAVAALFGALFQGGAGDELGARLRDATSPRPLQAPAPRADESKQDEKGSSERRF